MGHGKPNKHVLIILGLMIMKLDHEGPMDTMNNIRPNHRIVYLFIDINSSIGLVLRLVFTSDVKTLDVGFVTTLWL